MGVRCTDVHTFLDIAQNVLKWPSNAFGAVKVYPVQLHGVWRF